MAWTDIDFNLIIPGMITRGPASVSFADYLNEFSTALDERWNIVEETFNSAPTLFDIEFIQGEIRRPGDNDFWDKLRQLIGGYRDLWFDFNYYETGVLTDVLNAPDYLISDAELETAIGAEAFDILVNFATLSNQEIFKASIFQAFFIIYQQTEIIAKSTIIDTSSSDIYQNRPIIYRDALRYSWDSDIGANKYASYGAMTSAYAADVAATAITLGGSTPYINLLGVTRQSRSWNIIDEVGEWDLNDFGGPTLDLIEINYLSKDLDDNVLTMEITPGKVDVFINKVADDTSGTSEERAYTSKYLFADFTGTDNVLHTDDFSFSQDLSFGTIMSCSFGDDPGNIPPFLDTPDNTSTPTESGEGGSLLQSFRLDRPSTLFVNLNNSGLEFFITP